MATAQDPILEMFIYESLQLIEQLEELLLDAEKNENLSDEQINEVFRIMHTIKGSSAMMSFDNISHVAHSVEDLFYMIRDHSVVPTAQQWPDIFDLILRSSDFMKGEVEKIQNGEIADRSESDLVDELHGFSAKLKGGEAPQAAASAPTQTQATVATVADTSNPVGGASGGDGAIYCVKVFFEDGARMENIRAFGVLAALKNLSSDAVTIPEDIEADAATDEIAHNGVTFYVRSTAHIEELRGCVTETLFLKSYELYEVTDREEIPTALRPAPAAINLTFDMPAESVQAEVKSEPAATAPAAAQPESTPTPATPQASTEGGDHSVKQSFISVNLDKLDKLLDLVGEIVIHEAMVVKSSDLAGLQLENFDKAARELNKLTSELQTIVMSVRMIPVSSTFRKMQRIIRDMCKKVNKEAELVIIGEETEIDKNIIDNLSDPLMHLIRNSMDHGIESPDVREKAGKSRSGTITLEAKNSGSEVLITITDDGAGLNRDRIIHKAIEKGLTTKPESEITDREAYNFILMPGFSTKEQVTEFSGRGVGMDVVKRNIEKVGGIVNIDSAPGKGTVITIKIPLTLAIVDGMEISVAGRRFIVPIANIQVSTNVKKSELLIDSSGNEMVQIHGHFYPVVRLHKKFNIGTEITDIEKGTIMHINNGERSVCIFFDKLIGEQQIVVKPIPAYVIKNIGHIHGIGGCALLGDGSICLILDINDICE